MRCSYPAISHRKRIETVAVTQVVQRFTVFVWINTDIHGASVFYLDSSSNWDALCRALPRKAI
jgi:hypothetical protein